MVYLTRNNTKIYNLVKESILNFEVATQTDENDLIINNKRKLDEIELEEVEYEETDEEYEEEYEEYEDEDEETDEEYEEETDEEEYEEETDEKEKKDENDKEMNSEDLDEIVNQLIMSKLKKKQKKNVELLLNDLTEEETMFFDKLDEDEKAKYFLQYNNIVASEQCTMPLKFQILNADIDSYIKNIALQKCKALSAMSDNTSQSEFHKLDNWITNLCKVPFGKYVDMPVTVKSNPADIKEFLNKTKNILNEEVYGHLDAKDQIIRIVAQWISNPQSKGNVIGIHGSPGVGKTTLIKNGICKALNLPFASIPLGGASDSSYLDGHSYTYEGSTCGRIVDVLMKSKYMNPVIYFDELDKVSESAKGQELINLLIHLTDPSQNNHFQDKYFSEIQFDLSKCLIIFTYNNNNAIDPILKDRMITIHTKDYTLPDKTEIAKNHILPNIKRDFDIDEINILEEDIKYIVEKTTSEAGVRNLKRSLECIVSNLNLELLLTENSDRKLNIDKKIIDKYVKNNNNDINPSLLHLYT